MDIHSKIKSIRLKKNFSQSDMAEKMNLALLNYGKIERGVTELSVKRLYEIANILEVSVSELLFDSVQLTDNVKVKELESRILELEEKTELQRQLLEEKNNKLEKAHDIYSLYILEVFMRFGNFLAWDKFYGERDKNGVLPIILSDEKLKGLVAENLVEYMIEENDWLLNAVIREWNGDKRLGEFYNQYKVEIEEGRKKKRKEKTV
ncbi:MAG: helix-turn-helix domain-containing protein [Flavobacterium sp.]